MMKKTLTADDFRQIFNHISTVMKEQEGYLCKLDGAIGDGDLGVSMTIGFGAIERELASLQEEDVGILLMRSSIYMAEEAASTLGTLLAIAIMRGGKEMLGKRELDLKDIVKLNRTMLHSIISRGKAKEGEKTIVDAFVQANNALESCLNEGVMDLPAVYERAYRSAEQGVQKTLNMQAVHGRAGRYQERSIGHLDPGAVVGMLIFKSAYEYLKKT